MVYNYEEEKEKIFTERGQRAFLRVRDHVNNLLEKAGAFRMDKAMICGGDAWEQMAYVDRLVELGEIREVTENVWGQDRIFTR